jgi:hypothetical protein
MPDPVFDANDRVTPPAQLPRELQGQTAEQVARHYQQREATLRAQAEAAIANAGAGSQQPAPPARDQRTPITAADFETNPLDATQRMITEGTVSRQEWNTMTGAVQAQLIENAKRMAAEGSTYWARVLPTIDQYTQTAQALDKISVDFWRTAYNAAVGANLSRLQAEDAAAAQAATQSAEAPSGAGMPPPAPRTLSNDEMRVVEGLGITADLYRKGEENMRNNKFPLTLDNRRR